MVPKNSCLLDDLDVASPMGIAFDPFPVVELFGCLTWVKTGDDPGDDLLNVHPQ